jgi:FtsZ-binding cell division protein ZapB
LIDDTQIQTVFGGAAGLTFAGLMVRWALRLWSRGRVDGARDRAEIDVIAVLRDEVKVLRQLNGELSKERNDAVSKMGAMEMQIAFLRASVDNLREQVARLQDTITKAAAPPT